MEQARLIVCLEGTAAFETSTGDGIGETRLEPRDGLFVAPGRWVRSRPRKAYVSMGVVFYTGKTRVYLMRSAAARDGRPREPSVTAIVPDDGGEENRALLRVLEGREPGAAAGRYERNAFECLLIAVRDLLARPPETGAPGKARYTWEAACDFLVENLHRPVSRKDVARHLGVHPNHLSRLFAEFGSGTFSEFIQARRLDRARLLMADPRLNFAEVARLSGFSSANYFTRVFRAQTGRTPTRARSAGRPAQSRQASPK
jgi:AraC-like DNA-binding protein